MRGDIRTDSASDVVPREYDICTLTSQQRNVRLVREKTDHQIRQWSTRRICRFRTERRIRQRLCFSYVSQYTIISHLRLQRHSESNWVE